MPHHQICEMPGHRIGQEAMKGPGNGDLRIHR
jgi:hypothetical protein